MALAAGYLEGCESPLDLAVQTQSYYTAPSSIPPSQVPASRSSVASQATVRRVLRVRCWSIQRCHRNRGVWGSLCSSHVSGSAGGWHRFNVPSRFLAPDREAHEGGSQQVLTRTCDPRHQWRRSDQVVPIPMSFWDQPPDKG